LRSFYLRALDTADESVFAFTLNPATGKTTVVAYGLACEMGSCALVRPVDPATN
jgi:hypothetical protein